MAQRRHRVRPRTLLVVVAVLAAVAALVAGAVAVLLHVPSVVQTITVGGMERTYRLYRPARLPPQAPLVIMLHAAGANTIEAEQTSRWDRQAMIGKFVVAYPEGIGKTWNAFGCCGQAMADNVDDIAFITAMIDQIPGIDHKRMYVTGKSNGGMLAYTLACRTNLFAAIGTVATTMFDPCPDPHPTSVMHFHGLADKTVPFTGVPKFGDLKVDGPPVTDVMAFWRRVDSCPPPTTTKNGVLTIVGSKCPDDREVVLATLDNLGHDWPSEATSALWRFFAAHPG